MRLQFSMVPRIPASSRRLKTLALHSRARDPKAASFLDSAIRLREPEGTNSVAYWKDLQRRCANEFRQVTRNLSICEHAFQVRLAQPNATTFELASARCIWQGWRVATSRNRWSTGKKPGNCTQEQGSHPCSSPGSFVV